LESASVPPAAPTRGKLVQILGVGFGLAVIVGNTIGAGILEKPGVIAAQLPAAWMFLAIWLAGGLYALLGAISIAELGVMMPSSGGQYVFARHALGDYAGFVVGWSDCISTCAATAFISLLLSQYAGVLIPPLAPYATAVSVGTILFFTILQWRGTRWGGNTQNITSLLKAAALIVLVVACFALGHPEGHHEAAQLETPQGFALFVAIVISLQGVIYTYDGWTGVIYFSEEVRNPARDIPRSMFGGALSVIAIYLLINLATLYVLPISRIAGSDLALGRAAEVVFGARGDQIFRTLVMVGMFSAVNACQLMATRVLFAMGRDKLFLAKAGEANRGGTPTLALCLTTIVSIFFVVTGTTDQVSAVAAFFFVVNYAISFSIVFLLRRREPDRPRPYRAWGYPWTTGFSLLGSIGFLIGAVVGDPANSRYALLVLAVSYPIFLLIRRAK
jgi:APA family basic amino acid/polyamine antiporter